MLASLWPQSPWQSRQSGSAGGVHSDAFKACRLLRLVRLARVRKLHPNSTTALASTSTVKMNLGRLARLLTYFLFLAHISRAADEPGAGWQLLSERVGRALQPLRITIGEHDAAAALQTPFGESKPDARGAAGDHSHLLRNGGAGALGAR